MTTAPSRDGRAPYTFKQRLILAVAPPLAAGILKLLLATCRFDVRGREKWERRLAAGDHLLGGFWHESVPFVAKDLGGTNFYTLTSSSFDGELAARLVNQFGLRAMRGSSSRGGVQAVADLVRAAGEVQGVGFTLDGPKGPRRSAKAGIAMLAARTGLPIVPVATGIDRAWRLRTWDRFPVPKPFARVIVAYGDALDPPKNASREEIDRVRGMVEHALNRMHGELDLELEHGPQR